MIIEYINFLYFALPLIIVFALWHKYFYKKPTYLFSTTLSTENLNQSSTKFKDNVLFLIRLLTLISLCFAIARFRKPDFSSKIPVDGVDIMLVLDVSGSMQFFDDINDPRARLDVAKKEALKFISKRENDPIGLVIFAKDVVSRCPLTLDKDILKEIIDQTNIGIINPDGTVLSKAILAGVNRLKNSKAKSKIMIVLTDGEPSPEDMDPKTSVDLAKKLGIKIYTVGIGSPQGGLLNHEYFGLVKVDSKLNIKLLEAIANQTGGKFFLAESPADMESIYSTIDALEKTEYETPIYSRYYEYFIIFLWLSLILLLSEIILTSLIWLSL